MRAADSGRRRGTAWSVARAPRRRGRDGRGARSRPAARPVRRRPPGARPSRSNAPARQRAQVVDPHESHSRSGSLPAWSGLGTVRRSRPRATYPHKVTSSDGTPIALWRSGEGPPLVLVHGAARRPQSMGAGAPGARGALQRAGGRPSRPRAERRCGGLRDRARVRGRRRGRRVRGGRGGRAAGTPTAASARVEAALRNDRIRKLVLYEPSMGFLKSPPHVVRRLEELLAARAARRARRVLHGRGGRSRPPIRSSSCARCRPGGRAWPSPTRSRARSARAASTPSTRDRFRALDDADAVPPGRRQFRARSGTPARRCRRRCRTAGSSSCRGSGTRRWTPQRNCSRQRCCAFWRRARRADLLRRDHQRRRSTAPASRRRPLMLGRNRYSPPRMVTKRGCGLTKNGGWPWIVILPSVPCGSPTRKSLSAPRPNGSPSSIQSAWMVSNWRQMLALKQTKTRPRSTPSSSIAPGASGGP